MNKNRKKSGQQEETDIKKILLATAIIQLINAVIGLVATIIKIFIS